jgi:feruloyl-CoA synthase
MISGVGSTECGPEPMLSTWEHHRKPEAGLPLAGVALKLVPMEGTWELRMRGPCITPGYWRRPDLTAAAFDEEGFFMLGDAVKPLDPADFAQGLVFDGRISDNFKIATGVWVQVGAVRQALLAALAPVLRDAVITGHNRPFVGAIGFADPQAAAEKAGIDPAAGLAAALASPRLRVWLADRLSAFAARSPGASTRVMRLVLEAEPPSFDNGELTDKGVAAARLVLARRAAIVDELHAEPPGSRILAVETAASR